MISPRIARDNVSLRLSIQERISDLSVTKESLLYDLSGENEYRLSHKDKNIIFIENNTWDFIFDQINTNNEILIKNIKSTFNLSDTFIKALTLIDRNKLDEIKSSSYLSFSLCTQQQQKLYQMLLDPHYNLKYKADERSTVFWMSFLQVIIENTPDIASFKIGLSEKIACLLKKKIFSEALSFLQEMPFKLYPRFDENVILNLLVVDDEAQKTLLYHIKDAQILAGTNTDKKDLQDKFKALDEKGFI